MARKLKVFRTSAGFSDAYVAAPSRKAALAAWGADVDLFARGVAEEVTEPDLMVQPLGKPGDVFSVSRGDLAAHLEALQDAGPQAKRAPRSKAEMRPVPKKEKRPKRPLPSSERLDAARFGPDQPLYRRDRIGCRPRRQPRPEPPVEERLVDGRP